MVHHHARSGLLTCLVLLLLTACSATQAATPAASNSPSGSGTPMSPGMSMSPGMNMRGAAMTPGPSAPARMICSNEIRRDIQRNLQRSSPPSRTHSWAHGLYRCSYRLPEGKLVLTVKDSPNVESGRAYYRHGRAAANRPRRLPGLLSLGLPGYETPDGMAVFLKDGKTLQVDASRLPQRIGPRPQSRTDVAYAIAADVVACWSE